MSRPPFLNSFWLALQLLTRIPTPQTLTYSEQAWGKSALWFPLIGLIIGAILWLGSDLLQTVNPLFSAALLLAVWVGITGALHLDGFADTLDAWIGGMGDKVKTLAIMKDPASGPMAITGLVVLLLLKFVAIYSLIINDMTSAILWLPLIARGQLLLLLLTTPYAKASGMGYAMQQKLPKQPAWAMIWLLLIALVFLASAALVFATLVSLLLLIAYRRALCQRIDGITGDTLGAWVEISEVSLFILLILLN